MSTQLQINSQNELQTILSRHNIDLSKTFKGVPDLWDEIRSGECTLTEEDGELIRNVRVLNVEVRYDNRILVETQQVKQDGTVRKRNLPYLAEKLYPDESLQKGIIRTLKEELSLEQTPPADHIRGQINENVTFTSSASDQSAYGDLESRYTI
ncbi:MAG: hypothetical protein ABEI13_03305, partial [Candidatus Paceibacteria bacterium]